MTLLFSVGRWGGFYIARGFTLRVCLGFIAITFAPVDIDEIFIRAMQEER